MNRFFAHARLAVSSTALLLLSITYWSFSDAFVTPRVVLVVPCRHQFRQTSRHLPARWPLQLLSFEDPATTFSTLVVAADQSWRQYVSLAVIFGVLIDIVLGSPLANMLLKPMRGDQQESDDNANQENGKPSTKNDNNVNRSRERIDSESVAKAAIERAQNALELRRFLDERKTDWDRMEEMKRKLDAEMQDLDEDLKAREESLSKRRNPK